MTRDCTLIWQPPVEHCDGLSDLMHAATGIDIGDDATARLVMAQTNDVREAELLRAGTGFHFVRASPSLVKYICDQSGWDLSVESITDALTKVFDQYGGLFTSSCDYGLSSTQWRGQSNQFSFSGRNTTLCRVAQNGGDLRKTYDTE